MQDSNLPAFVAGAINHLKLTIMNRIYHNCEMFKVFQTNFDEIMSKRVTMLSSLEEYAMNQIRIQTFGISGRHNACFCDGCLFLDINKSGHNDCIFLVRGEYGLTSYYVDEDDNMYMMQFLN